ncbi:hypothetical protein ACROYT_G015427 [Oculina patagonica]
MKKYVKTFKELVNKVTGPSERDDSSSELSEQSQLTTMQASIPFFKYLEEPTPNEVYASKTNDYQRSSFMKSTGVTYELVCQICRHKYIGETSRSAYTRGKEHLRALEQREESSVLWRHCCDIHAGNIAGFTMNVTGTFQNDAMLRQITESVMINQTKEDQLINTKEEWAYFRIPRAVVTQS